MGKVKQKKQMPGDGGKPDSVFGRLSFVWAAHLPAPGGQPSPITGCAGISAL